jgi:hypothetical protein
MFALYTKLKINSNIGVIHFCFNLCIKFQYEKIEKKLINAYYLIIKDK